MSTSVPAKRVIRFQVASDLHLEHDGTYETLDVPRLPGVDVSNLLPYPYLNLPMLLPGDVQPPNLSSLSLSLSLFSTTSMLLIY